MFDIGFSEIFVIAVVALLVLGPERLPKAARFAGLWVRRARAQWYSVKAELETELADEELRRSLRQAQDQLRSAETALRAQAAQVEQGVRGLAEEVKSDVPAYSRTAVEGDTPAVTLPPSAPASQSGTDDVMAPHAPATEAPQAADRDPQP
ncbi:Sec-independent protein translocase protein TatB [Aerolutibacter daejeonensis]|uniref:Sec-independent protein translocase protein TatB n=1 Tax=Aerolutibacter daejeonensis TaxID=346181 RepID=UPI000A0648B4|nr:Sec-independent protein translocase protein TatB [Lysobacter daejeonensis]